MRIFNTAIQVLGLALLAGCASINNPEGGPKDETAPTLVSSNPTDQDLNVKTNTITLDFDEEVQQNNLTKELLITPNLENKYRVRTDKNQLQLIFEKPFQDSTTYILNFRKGIQDITEKNVAQDLKLAFSTGSFIDTSTVNGTVVKLLTDEPLKETIVALYPANDTLSIRKNKPYYQTSTNETGQFTFTNIKEGSYNIFALQDQNNNSLYDNENETIAYLQNPIKVTPKPQQLELKVIRIDTKGPVMLQRERYADRFTGVYNEGIIRATVRKETSAKDSLTYKLGTDGKTIQVFKTKNFTSGKAIFTAVDSSGNTSIDTLQIEFTTRYAQNIKGAQLKVLNNARDNTTYRPGQVIIIEFQTPVRISGGNPVSIVSDSLNRTALKFPGELVLDKTATEMSFIVPKLKAREDAYTIAIDSTQIVPLEGPRFSLPELQFQISETLVTGSVSGKITIKNKSFVVQLLDSNNKVVSEMSNRTSYNFRNREPGTYRIRVLIDENNNGKWDGPDPSFKRNQEKVYFHPKPITIRANWDLEDENIEITE